MIILIPNINKLKMSIRDMCIYILIISIIITLFSFIVWISLIYTDLEKEKYIIRLILLSELGVVGLSLIICLIYKCNDPEML